MCDGKWILYDNLQWPVQWMGQEEAPKHFPKPNLHQKRKGSWALFGGLLPDLIHYSFVSPNEAIASEKYAQQIYEMHWKLQHMQLALVNRKGPTHLHDNTWLYVTEPSHQGFKSWTNWATNLSLICHIHLTSFQPTTTSSSIMMTFYRETGFHNQQETKNICKIIPWIPKHGFLCYRNK